MARFWKGVVLTSYLKRKGEFFSWPGREVWPFFISRNVNANDKMKENAEEKM